MWPFLQNPEEISLEVCYNMILDVSNYDHKQINDEIRPVDGDITLTGCIGQRFIATGMSNKHITVKGIPGNALGAYLDGAIIDVHSNAQDTVGDTMNDGKIIVHGNIGDAAGYAMRGGKMFIKGNAGYRAGIHMKEYKEKKPVMIIGGHAGSFLGEYQAGGIIVVLGLTDNKAKLVGNFPCTGMHGGKIYLRGDVSDISFPMNVCASPAGPKDLEYIKDDLTEYCELFDYDIREILSSSFTVLTPDSKNPYKQMYVAN